MYVLYADIMGFKERVMRTEHSKLKEEFEKLKNRLRCLVRSYPESRPFQNFFFL